MTNAVLISYSLTTSMGSWYREETARLMLNMQLTLLLFFSPYKSARFSLLFEDLC